MTNNNKSKNDMHYAGHRARVRKLFMELPEEQVGDELLLEILLYLVYNRKDVKPIAKQILHSFGNIRKLSASTKKTVQTTLEKDKKYSSCSQSMIDMTYFVAKMIREISLRVNRQKFFSRDTAIFNSWDQIILYLRQKFGNLTQEHFNVLFLSANNTLLDLVTMSIGTIDEVAVYDKEIAKQGLILGAVSIILSHNHFSGNVEPSEHDKQLTIKISDTCSNVGIEVLDHIIVSNDSYFSFKENGIPITAFKL